MSTCFLFNVQPNQTEILSLVMGANGEVQDALSYRSINQIIDLQQNVKTRIILPTSEVTLHQIDLPWLPERKARVAIPYALEEELTQPVEEIQVAFNRSFFNQNRYLVVVINKPFLKNLITWLDHVGIEFSEITMDWFALQKNEMVMTPHNLLVRMNEFNGAINMVLVDAFLKNLNKNKYMGEDTKLETISPTQFTSLKFKDSFSLQDSKFQTVQTSFYEWAAERLVENPSINLCQGEFQRQSKTPNVFFWFKTVTLLFGLWISSIVIMNGLNLYFLNKTINQFDQQIAQLYKVFFPESTQVISPKFRIGQLLQSNALGSENMDLWNMLQVFSKAFSSDGGEIQQIQFNQKRLTITLHSPTFEALDSLQQKLKSQGYKVNQNQAISKKNFVLAVVELSL